MVRGDTELWALDKGTSTILSNAMKFECKQLLPGLMKSIL
jgi:hypothetical protein